MAITIGTSWTELASKSTTYNGAKVTFYLDAKRGTQSVANNTTPIDVRLRSVFSGNFLYTYGYSFSATYCTTKSSTSGQWNVATETILSGSKTITHNNDGTWSGTISANAYLNSICNLSLSASVSLPTIPRASNPTFSPSAITLNGSNSFTINMNRASNSFTHDVSWSVGNKSGSLGTNIADSVKWTPPISLITEFYNLASKQGTLTTKTYNGSTLIGTTTANFTLNNPGGDDFSLSKSNLTISSRNSNLNVNCSPKYSGFGHNIYYKVSGGSEHGISLGSPSFPVNWKPYYVMDEFPNNTSVSCEIIMRTTYNNTVIYNGEKKKSVTLTVDTKVYKPTLTTPVLTEMDSVAAAIEGANTFIRYVSDIKVTAQAGIVADSGSTIKTVRAECGSTQHSQTTASLDHTFNNINGSKIKVEAMDSRGVVAEQEVPFTLIPYVLLTINANGNRREPTSNVVDVEFSGAYYNGSLGTISNSLEITYKYKERGTSTWIDGTGTLTPTIGSNSTYEGTGALAEQFDYTKNYDIRIIATDEIMSVYRDLIVYQGIPIYHWGVHDTNGNHFDVEGDFRIHQHGIPGEAITMTKQSTGLDIGGQVYNVAGFYRMLPDGNDSLNYWTNLNDGIYWVNDDVDVTNLPNDFGFVHVINHGNEFSVMFYANGGNKVYHKWGHKDTQGTESYPWKEFQMVDETNWITLNDTAKVYYRKKSGIVTVVINNMNNTQLTNGDLLGTLPTGFRPAYPLQVRNSFDNANGRLCVWVDGTVTYGSNIGTANYIRAIISYPV